MKQMEQSIGIRADFEDHMQYFQAKLDRETSPAAQLKYRKQFELLEDAVVIYHESRPAEYTADAELDVLTNLFVQWWFIRDIDNVEFFNNAMRNCPTLSQKANAYLTGAE